MKKTILALLLTGCLSAGAAHAEVIFTESFESPTVASFSTSFSPGWTVNKSETDSVGLLVGFNAPMGGVAAHNGSQVAVFNANDSATGASISRFITTVIGQEYQVSLYFLSYYSPLAEKAGVQLVFGSASTSAIASTADTWTELTLNFTAIGTSTELSIIDTTPGITNFKDLWVDDIVVTALPIPEPSTLGVLLLGGATLLIRSRARRR